jgi:hypothetical protein
MMDQVQVLSKMSCQLYVLKEANQFMKPGRLSGRAGSDIGSPSGSKRRARRWRTTRKFVTSSCPVNINGLVPGTLILLTQ